MGQSMIRPAKPMKVMEGGKMSQEEINRIGIERLERSNKLLVEQKMNLSEVITQGFWDEKNSYKIVDGDTNQLSIVVKENSETCDRLCCHPHHSFTLTFHLVDLPSGELYNAPPFATVEREGCGYRYCGQCSCNKWLCCCACNDSCRLISYLHWGFVGGLPEEPQEKDVPSPPFLPGTFPKDNVMGRIEQPIMGGGLHPTLNLYRGMSREPEQDQFGQVSGPFCFGGCLKLCMPFDYPVVDLNDSEIARIRREKAGSGTRAKLREVFSASDYFSLEFGAKANAGPERMTILSSLFMLDYMLFEFADQNIVGCDSEKGIYCTCCFLYCCGCLVPCQICTGNDKS